MTRKATPPRRKILAVSVGAASLLLAAGAAYAAYAALLFKGGDTRLYDDGHDWAEGSWKGECGQNTKVLSGVSVTPAAASSWRDTEYAHKVICTSSNLPIDQSDNLSLAFWVSDVRPDGGVNGNWGEGLYKAECPLGYAITGLAQHEWQGFDAEISNKNEGWVQTGVARCSRVTGMTGVSNCESHDFRNHDVREANSEGGHDWDRGYIKGQCGPGRFMKGIATGGYRPVAILCCSANF